MIQLLIEGREAALKDGETISLKFENPLFDGEDSFSLNISLPARPNMAIFGELPRFGMTPKACSYAAELRSAGMRLVGSVQVTSITDKEIKVQFLEGRKANNISKLFEETYINELKLYQATPDPDAITPLQAVDDVEGRPYYCLPWVNTGTEYANMQNEVTGEGYAQWQWSDETKAVGLSYQCKLVDVIAWVCREIGFSCDLSALDDDAQHIIVANALPAAWEVPELAVALPHWTVSEFFDHLSIFLAGRFRFDHGAKHMTFIPHREAVGQTVTVSQYSDAVDIAVTDDATESKYIGTRVFAFADGGSHLSKFYSCDWLFNCGLDIVEFDNIEALVTEARNYFVSKSMPNAPDSKYGGPRASLRNFILHAVSEDAYFIFKCSHKDVAVKKGENGAHWNIYDYYYELLPVNAFSSHDDYDGDKEELECIPVCIDSTGDENYMTMFLDPGSYGGDAAGGLRPDVASSKEEAEAWIPQMAPYKMIANGKSEDRNIYDKLFLAYYNPAQHLWSDCMGRNFVTPRPVPRTMRKYIFPDTEKASDGTTIFDLPAKYSFRRAIDGRVKHRVSFLAMSAPDIMSTFIIGGRRFICAGYEAELRQDQWPVRIKADMYRVIE